MRGLVIKKISKKEQQPFITLVDQILSITSKESYKPKGNTEDNKKVKELEEKIDEMVFDLYELTEEEKKIMRKSNIL